MARSTRPSLLYCGCEGGPARTARRRFGAAQRTISSTWCDTHQVLDICGVRNRLSSHCLQVQRPVSSSGAAFNPRPLGGPAGTWSLYHLSVLQSTGIQSRWDGALLPALCPQPCPRPPTLGIEELCQKREELCRQIQQEEDEKQRLQNEVRQLTEKLARVNENLARKIASRNEFDQTIAETEAAYLKILESSQTLLNVLKKEAGNLSKATASEQKSSGGKDS